MHFITGGYFNGKSKWVKEHYQLLYRNDYTWISAYKQDSLDLLFQTDGLYIVEGIEIYLKELVEKGLSIELIREKVRSMIDIGLEWEFENSKRKFIIMGTDISKGVVPIDRKERQWRDITGWVYQDIVSKSEEVDVIWYGITNKLK
ncbi:bifunctional adenosylcobinamide kinase/adenosylcobinamide-phosphate guanylyltransferase [Heyndrickxia sporothermodurans]